ncbi:unnamed protein product [Litomosoides sigmodontis]|uniref:Uncharacterized protein n=1 Tax=Litomosoides sigmodontis TaxID=42156 RepID=A0A3P6UEK5_LITSI|nr:unnamed protein product [Litomosoides sigmodontis]
MIMMVQMPPARTIPLSLLLLAISSTMSNQYYDPTARDYVETCDEMAQLAGDNFCRVFNICCRDRAKNKLNGDRCQLTDPTNGCQLSSEVQANDDFWSHFPPVPEYCPIAEQQSMTSEQLHQGNVEFLRCRAYNCTPEVTTTTTTTTTTARALFLSSSSTCRCIYYRNRTCRSFRSKLQAVLSLDIVGATFRSLIKSMQN